MPRLWIPERRLSLPKTTFPHRHKKAVERVPTRREIRNALHVGQGRDDGSPYTKASLAVRKRRQRLANQRARAARRAGR